MLYPASLAIFNLSNAFCFSSSDAKQSIDNKYNEQSNTINTTPDATDEEKQKALDKLKIAKDAGYNKVDQAQTNQQVSDAKTEAIDTITNIQANVAKNHPLEWN